jgi:putative tryptophan/tyrosine transport system substrate-binding protein
MMNRRRFLQTVSVSLLAAPLAAGAQSAKAPRVGFLGLGSAEGSPAFEALRQGLRQQGWVEGQSIAFEDRSDVDQYKRLPDVAAELVRLKVDVIVTYGTTAALAARKATATIPIVTRAGADPVETGLAASLARPGGNVTGVTTSGRDMVGKRLELLKETLPGRSRIAVLWDPESRTELGSLKNAEAAARSLGLKVQPVEVRRPEDFEKAFASMAHGRVEALASVASIMFRVHRARIAELAARHRLPSTFEDRDFVQAGGLMSYGPDLNAINRQLATYVDRILKGAKPGDLPFEQPIKFELVINMKTAKALRLTIPPSVLARADQVVE